MKYWGILERKRMRHVVDCRLGLDNERLLVRRVLQLQLQLQRVCLPRRRGFQAPCVLGLIGKDPGACTIGMATSISMTPRSVALRAVEIMAAASDVPRRCSVPPGVVPAQMIRVLW